MKVNEFELENLSETLSTEQIRLICHVSKLTARFYVKSGLIKNKNSGKQTRCYSVARENFLKFIEEYKEDPSRFIPPPDWYKSAGHTKAKKTPKTDSAASRGVLQISLLQQAAQGLPRCDGS